MQGLKVGHFTNTEKGTGVSVFLFNKPAVGAYLIAGSGPASIELAPLDPEISVPNLHGLCFSGGSAFGVYSAKGVMRYLSERQIGLPLPHGCVIPIVPGAAIYDLKCKSSEPPTDGDAYQACLLAKENNTESGRIGAGTGATVGKIVTTANCMTSGIGRAELSLPNGVSVTAYAVVNAVGDIRDEENRILAGSCNAQGDFINGEKFLLAGGGEALKLFEGSNTTLIAVFTNAKFNKSELKRISKMAIAGIARAISPIFTCYDGDILFSISIGDVEAPVISVGTLAAETTRLAILDAVKDSEIVSCL